MSYQKTFIFSVVLMGSFACGVDDGATQDTSQGSTTGVPSRAVTNPPLPSLVSELSMSLPQRSTPQNATKMARGEAVGDSCALAASQYKEPSAYISCKQGLPVDQGGNFASSLPTSPGEETLTSSCNTYYGKCSGFSGCSRSSGEGWELVACGTWLYTWLTICEGQPRSWGTGFCFY